MSTDTDRLAERLAGVESTTEQMNERLSDIVARMDTRTTTVDERFNAVDTRFDAMESRFDRLDDKIEQNRREMRRLILILFAGLSLVVAVVSIVVQVAL